MRLCDPCTAEWTAWLDYRPPAPLRIHVIGENTHAVRHGARVLDTIRQQQALIRHACEREHQRDPFDDLLAAVLTTDDLAVIDELARDPAWAPEHEALAALRRLELGTEAAA